MLDAQELTSLLQLLNVSVINQDYDGVRGDGRCVLVRLNTHGW